MVLHDYLEDRPIKCFYDISFHKTEFDISNNKSGIYYVKNDFNYFYKGDTLPTKTNYYYYPDDFYIYDYTSDEHIIHVIKNKIYQGFQSVDEISIDFKSSFIINMDGSEILDIKSKNDLYEIVNHWRLCKEEYNRLNDKYFPNGLLSTFMGNTNTFNEAKPLFNKEWDAVLEEFKIIWIKKDKFYNEKRYGALLEAIKNVYWDLKNDCDLSNEEKIYLLSLAYDELELLEKSNPNIKEKYLNLFDFVKEVHVNNVISMVEKYIKQN